MGHKLNKNSLNTDCFIDCLTIFVVTAHIPLNNILCCAISNCVFTGGYQTRSRAVLKPPTPGGEPCPTALWETRPCFTGPCLTFGWVVDDDGHISCQRSDGVIVEGKFFLLLTLAFCRILVVHFVIIIQLHVCEYNVNRWITVNTTTNLII